MDVWLNARVDRETYEDYRALCTDEGRTVSEDIRRYLERRIKRANNLPATHSPSAVASPARGRVQSNGGGRDLTKSGPYPRSKRNAA
jgi:hypothetical protein